MNTIRPLIAASAMACASLASAGMPALVEFGRHVPGFESAGLGRYAVADFDRDGRDDIVVPAKSGTALFQVFGLGATGIVSKQAVFLPDSILTQLLAVTIAGQPQLVTVSQDGVVRRFAGWPLVEVHSFEVGAPNIGAAAIGDIDNDGAPDLVTSTMYWDASLRANVLLDGEPRWSLPMTGGSDILLGQFDADPALEIVLAGIPGRVIDGATQATDWTYKDGFGDALAAGRFQATGGNQFVTERDSGAIMAFQSAPWSPVWDLDSLHVSALTTADLDADGYDDIIAASAHPWMDINIIDGLTHAVSHSIPYDGYEVAAVSVWDHDGDGEADIAFGPRDTVWSTAPLAQLADVQDGTILWQLAGDQPPPYQRLAMGRHGTGYSLVYPFGTDVFQGGWAQVDAVYGTAQWRTPPYETSESMFAMVPRDTAYANGGSHLVLAGDHWSTGARFLALDSQSHALRWMLDGTISPALVNRELEALTEFDLDGSSTLAACLHGSDGKRLVLVDAVAGTLSWTSVVMGEYWNTCDVLAGQFENGASPLVVAVLDTSLRAYDTATHLLAWTLPGTIAGASLIEQGVAGREFVVFEDSQLRFHDAGTLALLRTYDLGVPISAVRQLRGDIHGLLVAADGRLLVVDGANGSILFASRYLGFELGQGNRIAATDLGAGYTMIAVGSHGGVFRYRLYTGDGIFTDGFESSVD